MNVLATPAMFRTSAPSQLCHGSEALAGLLPPGNAGSNTAADHVKVLDMVLAAARARPASAR